MKRRQRYFFREAIEAVPHEHRQPRHCPRVLEVVDVPDVLTFELCVPDANLPIGGLPVVDWEDDSVARVEHKSVHRHVGDIVAFKSLHTEVN